MVTTIGITEALTLGNEALFVDTRSPKEFAIDRIPQAINIPIFSNEERAIVGTLYKEDKIKAYQEGFQLYNKKILDFIEEFKKLDEHKKIIIYCWRGGMRSKTIAELITRTRPEVYQLINGYKDYRRVVRERLEEYVPPFKLIVLQGLAGCGKTDLIKQLHPSINLEELAGHRSSVFGAIGLEPVSQKMFDTLLLEQLNEYKNEKVVFIEGEAKKVGNVSIPNKFFETMQRASTVLITLSLEERSKRIVQDYFTHHEDSKIKEIIMKLKAYISTRVAEELCELIDKKEYEEVAKVLLRDYYDPQYSYFLKDKTYALEINNTAIDESVKTLHSLKETS